MKQFRTSRAAALFLFLVIICGLVACTLPIANPTSEPTRPLAPTQTALPASTSAPTVGNTPTLQSTLTSTPKIVTPTPITPTVTPPAAYKGFIAYNRAQETWTGYDFTGAPISLSLKVPGAEWIGYNTAQFANNSAYYVKPKDKSVVQIALNGAAQKLAFIPAKDSLHFLISLDGKKIAWSFITQSAGNPASELWLANIDGTGIKKISQIDAAANAKWLTLEPFRWLPDGRLLYIDEPTGIGGYILFYGFAGIHVYDPSTGTNTNLTPAIGAGNLCLREISKDLKILISTCATGDHSTLSYVTTAAKQYLSITLQADQNQAGSALYSPTGDWMAFAYARGDASSEIGKVAVVPANGTTPKILATAQKGYFNVIGWVNDLQFIVQRYDNDLASLWLFSRDSGNPIKLADGTFVSLIQK